MKGRKTTKGPQPAINAKTQAMIAEGYKPAVASAAAHSMARSGRLGPEGGYRRVHRDKRGPIGKMRRDA